MGVVFGELFALRARVLGFGVFCFLSTCVNWVML